MRSLGLLGLLLLSACYTPPEQGSLDDARVYHWENEYASMEQFINDHKACLNVKKKKQHRNSLENFLFAAEPDVVPQWDSLWATFESRRYQEAGQRISFSVPQGSGEVVIAGYRACMQKRGYKLTFLR